MAAAAVASSSSSPAIVLGRRRRASRTAGRTEGRPRGWRGSGPRGRRPGPRRPPRWSAASARRRASAARDGTPSSSSSRGSGFGPRTWVTDPVDECDGKVGRRAEREDRDHDEAVRRARRAIVDSERAGQRGRAAVTTASCRGSRSRRRARRRVAAGATIGHAHVERPLERGAAVGDQVVAGISVVEQRSTGRSPSRRRAASAISAAVRATSTSVASRAAGKLLDRVAVAVARREVHLAERTPRRAATSSTRLTLSTNWAQSNHEMRRMLVITLRTVTFIGRLALVLEADQSPRRWCPACEQLLQPAERRGDGRVLVAQPLEELDAGRRSGAWSAESRRNARGGDLGAVVTEAEQAVGELVGDLSRPRGCARSARRGGGGSRRAGCAG